MTESPTPVSGDAMELVERLEARINEIERYCERVPESDLTRRAPEHVALYRDAKAEIERLRSRGGAPEGLTRLREKLSDFIDHVEGKRDSAKAAATHYPSKAATVLGEADAYDDVAADLRAMLSAAPQPPVSQSVQPPEGGTGWPELPCRFSERGCTGHAVGIFHVPQGCHCWPDPIQALCAQHACKADSPGPIECVIDFSCASPPGQDDRTNDGSETDGGLNEDLVLVPSEIVDRFPEINPSNYDHDDACALNAWGVELVLAAKPMSALPRKDVEGADSEDRPPGTYITIRLDDDKAGIAPGRVQVTYLSTQGEDL